MTRVVSVAPAFPPHAYDQQRDHRRLRRGRPARVPADDRRVLERLHRATGVQRRHLALPLEDLRRHGRVRRRQRRLHRGRRSTSAPRPSSKALAAAGLDACRRRRVMTTTVTGIAAPTLDARLVPRLGLRADVRRVPMFGLGCVAGAAGIARLHDLVARRSRTRSPCCCRSSCAR